CGKRPRPVAATAATGVSNCSSAVPPSEHCCTWLSNQGSEHLLGQIASVYGGRLPHRAVLSNDYLSGLLIGLSTTTDAENAQLCMATLSPSLMKTVLKMERSRLQSGVAVAHIDDDGHQHFHPHGYNHCAVDDDEGFFHSYP
ncbi:unnamed protein product, partial [Dibothriocephalus latus]